MARMSPVTVLADSVSARTGIVPLQCTQYPVHRRLQLADSRPALPLPLYSRDLLFIVASYIVLEYLSIR
eukprot:COSAG02_NODE_2946_length_7685_cov_17.516478_1_plen_69_part_00